MKTLIATSAVMFALATPAWANQCPALMTKIDEAIASTTVDQATKDKVMALYEEGKAAHEAGDHPTSEAKLGEALALLGM
jgi:hypothetical protein